MGELSVTEFENMISDGAIVYCTNRKECLEVIDFLESLGFPLSQTIRDFEGVENYLSPGLNRRKVISRYSNCYVEDELKEQSVGTIIHFEEVPFKEVCSQQSDEDFNECFTRFLLN